MVILCFHVVAGFPIILLLFFPSREQRCKLRIQAWFPNQMCMSMLAKICIPLFELANPKGISFKVVHDSALQGTTQLLLTKHLDSTAAGQSTSLDV